MLKPLAALAVVALAAYASIAPAAAQAQKVAPTAAGWIWGFNNRAFPSLADGVQQAVAEDVLHIRVFRFYDGQSAARPGAGGGTPSSGAR